MPSFLKKVLAGASWMAIGLVISRGAALLSSVVAARSLGPSEFGALGILQNTVGMFQILATLGLGLAATRELAGALSSNPERVGVVVFVARRVAWIAGGVSTLLLAVSAPWLAERALLRADLATPLLACSCILGFAAVGGAQLGTLAGFGAFRSSAIAQALTGLVQLAVTAATVNRFGLAGAVAGLVAGAACSTALGAWLVRRELAARGIPPVRPSLRAEAGSILRFSIPTTLASLVTGPALWLSHTLLVRSAAGYEAMGVLNAGNQWFGAISMLPAVLSQPLLASFSGSYASGRIAEARALLRQSIAITASVAALAWTAIAVASPLLMAAYGPDFRPFSPVLVWLAAAAAVFCVQAPIGYALLALGRAWLGFWMNLAWGTAMVLATWAMLNHAAEGVAIARFGAYTLHLLWSAIVYRLVLPRDMNGGAREP